MQLQPNEHYIINSNDNQLAVTNIRVASSFKDWGHSSKTYLYLEDISSVQSVYKSNIYFLVLAGACLLYVAIYALSNGDMNGPGMGGIIGAAIGIALWLYSRKRVIAIHPNGGRPVEFVASDMTEEGVIDFMETVQLAKTARILHLQNRTA